MLKKWNLMPKALMLKAAILFSAAFLAVGFSACQKTRDTAGDTYNNRDRVATESPNRDSAYVRDRGAINKTGNDMLNIFSDLRDDMNKADLIGDYDYDYAQMMIEHHRAEVDLLDEEIDNGKDMALVNMSKTEKDMKNKEIDHLKDFADDYKDKWDERNKNNKISDDEKNRRADRIRAAYMAPYTDMMNGLRSDRLTGNTDADFVMLAISAKQSGIKMSNIELKNGTSAKLKDMTRNMIKEDERAIKELQKWQNTRRTSSLSK